MTVVFKSNNAEICKSSCVITVMHTETKIKADPSGDYLSISPSQFKRKMIKASPQGVKRSQFGPFQLVGVRAS